MPKKPTDAADQADQTADPAAPQRAAEPEQPQPATAGVYVRQPGGALQAVDGAAAQALKE